MRTNVRDTSIDAYNIHHGAGKAATQSYTVYKYILEHPSGRTRQEISAALGIPINAICGRVNELIGSGVASELGRRDCTITGSSAHPVYIRKRAAIQ